jgi:hypothetical protein
MAGTWFSAALLAPLAIPGYMFGSGRWLRRDSSVGEIGGILFACFLVWYFFLRMLDGSKSLVPVALIVVTASFGAGRLEIEWERRAGRKTKRPRPDR